MTGVAQVTDTGASILFASTLLSSSAFTSPIKNPAGATMTVNGTATFSTAGMNPGSAGGITITGLDVGNALVNEGQIAFDITTEQIAQYDNAATVTGSIGEAKSANQYLLSLQDSVPTNQGSLLLSAGEYVFGSVHGADTQKSAQIHSAGLGTYTRLCLWWKGAIFGLYNNGRLVWSGARANFGNVFNKLNIGASFNGTGFSLVKGHFKNLVISRAAPRFLRMMNRYSIGSFGDSFVSKSDALGGAPLLDLHGGNLIDQAFSSYGITVGRMVLSGYGGYSVCDTGANDLSSVIDAYIPSDCDVSAFMAFNDDCTASAAQIADVSTGTQANAMSFMAKIAGITAVGGVKYKNCKKIILTTPGSLKGNNSIDTATYNANRATVDAIVKGLPALWDATYPAYAGMVVVYDLFTALGGDDTPNLNYQGWVNAVGNVTTGAGTNNDRHPSALGFSTLWTGIAQLAYR